METLRFLLLLTSITRDQSTAFQNQWNSRRDHLEKSCITYDSTNKTIAYDHNNSEPYYEEYPGSHLELIFQEVHIIRLIKEGI